jgi:transcriptional regulator with GAF, ATPase, and Fis domain
MAQLCAYPWPGNIRELQNLIERAVVLTTGPVLTIEESALPATSLCGDEGALCPATSPTAAAGARMRSVAPALPRSASLEEIERQHILTVLRQTHWRIEGTAGAAKLLNLQPSTLRSRMQRLGITRPG